MMRVARWAMVWALISTACSHSTSASRATFSAAQRALGGRADADLGCPGPTLSELSPGHVAAAGCGRQREYREVCGAGGCTWVALDDLVPRAAFDLECPVDRVSVRSLGDSTRGVAGCGMRATYVLMCTDAICHWLPSTRSRSRATLEDLRRAAR